ncbi:TPA: prepilin peptidase [Campylobacter fetus subsp. venerealis]|nr:prepilin peptidase [Campylobacter fetus]HDX6251728.1 prepilin peptidase [Campylobacter fetus subsp. venerealis]EAJ0322118.1 prepilin peptidase [Campylobacter fetus]EAK0819573.1 prepilin peptidase [Campylobacter fetus]EEL0850059.1 prepilin peptidase [Campylobacter fetus]
MIYRMPLAKSIIYPASHCPKCEHKLSYIHNIPLFSWIFLRGKCAFCKESISPIYPITELVCGLLGMFSLYISSNLINAILLGLCLILLFTLSVIDFKYSAVPESLLIITYFLAIFSTFDTENTIAFDESLLNSPFVISLIFAGAITIVKSVASAWINRNSAEIIEPMGDADTIIIAIIGALAGIGLGIFAIVLAAILQIILHILLKKQNKEVPFIPALSLSLFIILIFKTEFLQLLEIYLKFVGI